MGSVCVWIVCVCVCVCVGSVRRCMSMQQSKLSESLHNLGITQFKLNATTCS